METTLQQSITANYTATATKTNLWKRFINWCDSQEQFRFGWLGAALAVHGCIATPLTLFAIILSGNYFAFWIVAIAAMGASITRVNPCVNSPPRAAQLRSAGAL